MKKLIIIYMLLGISIISFGQREFNPYAISIDTVKYKNEIKTNGTSVHYMSKYKDGSFSRDEVEDFYFYPEGMSFERKDDFYVFENRKSYSHRIKDNATFNKITDCEFFYEAAWMSYGVNERIIARYEGVYYEITALDDLLINTGLIETISVEEKIHIILQWHYWLVDQNIEIVNLEKVIDREDWGQYEGQVRVDGEICNIWRIIVRGRQSFFSDIIINCEDVGGMNMIFGKRSSDTKSGNENIKLNHNNNDIVPSV